MFSIKNLPNELRNYFLSRRASYIYDSCNEFNITVKVAIWVYL